MHTQMVAHLKSKDLEMVQKFYDRVLVIWYIHIIHYHVVIKKNDVDFYRVWKDSKDIVSENARCRTVTTETTVNSRTPWRAGLGVWEGLGEHKFLHISSSAIGNYNHDLKTSFRKEMTRVGANIFGNIFFSNSYAICFTCFTLSGFAQKQKQ